MAHWLIAAFRRYGYGVILVGIFFESLGIPLPGETVLLAGGFFARHGALSIWKVITFAFLAALAGDNTGYWLGRRMGRGWIERWGRWVGLTPRRLAAVDEFFARHGLKTVLVARFLSGVRVVAALFAGVARIPYRSFVLFNTAGSLLWAISIGLVGFCFGQSWDLIGRWIGRAGIFLVSLVLLIVLFRSLRSHHGRLWRELRDWFPEGLTARQVWLLLLNLAALGILTRIGGRAMARHANHFDFVVLDLLRRFTSPLWDGITRGLAIIGSAPTVALLVAALAVWCVRRRDRRGLAVLLGLYALSLPFNLDLEVAWGRFLPAPGNDLADMLGLESSGAIYGWARGHALTTATAFGTAALLLARWQPRWAWPPAAVATLLVSLIGCARVYLGLDWPTGVLAGFAVSAVLLLLGAKWLGAATELPEADAGTPLPGGTVEDASEAATGSQPAVAATPPEGGDAGGSAQEQDVPATSPEGGSPPAARPPKPPEG